MSIEFTTLPNGLRIITDTVKEVDSIAIGVWADVGTRHEDMNVNGVAHMVEHMMFKGTPTRTAVEIAEQVEDAGGQVNAYTSREITAYHIHLLKNDLDLATSILSDIIQHSHMPEDEVERERDVILQEIGMTADTPDDIIFDNYQEIAYAGQALGNPILGRSDIIGAMQRDTLMNYVRRFYTPSRLVISAAGHVEHDALLARVTDLFTDLPGDDASATPPASYLGGESRTEKPLEQSHVVLGFQGISRHDADYYTAAALSTILGGGMSSRLFQEVREKRGLVYSIFSFHSSYQDDGQFAIYAGTGPDKLPELVPVVCDEVRRICDTVVNDAELRRAKAQMRANLLMGRESMMTRANQQAKQLVHYGELLDIASKLEKIEAISTENVIALARRIFTTRPTLAALGPLGKLDSYDAIAARLAA